MEKITRRTTGLIIGKFLPPHTGHRYLVDFARNYVDDLMVLVCSIPSEPIPGELRVAWMQEMFPDVRILHHTRENPQEPHEHEDFWQIWEKSIFELMPDGADYLFASEDYGKKLAETLGMSFIPVDHGREVMPISGTAIRNDPLKNWEFIPSPVRPYYLKKVCVFGPESTGKTTLTQNLARKFDTAFVPEYARGLLDLKDGKVEYSDIPLIARGQLAAEKALTTQANKILFCDTDLLTTTIWSEVLFGKCPEWVQHEAEKQRYDLYLLTDIDIPWVNDPQRYLPERRKEFFDHCRYELDRNERPYCIIRGDGEERLLNACRVVQETIGVDPII